MKARINFEEELLKRGVPAEYARYYSDCIEERKFYIRRPSGSKEWQLEVILCIDTEPSGIKRVCLEKSENVEEMFEALERWLCGIFGAFDLPHRFNSEIVYSWLLNEDEKKRFFMNVNLDDAMIVEAGIHYLVLYKSKGLANSVTEDEECFDFYGMYFWSSSARKEMLHIREQIKLWKQEVAQHA